MARAEAEALKQEASGPTIQLPLDHPVITALLVAASTAAADAIAAADAADAAMHDSAVTVTTATAEDGSGPLRDGSGSAGGSTEGNGGSVSGGSGDSEGLDDSSKGAVTLGPQVAAAPALPDVTVDVRAAESVAAMAMAATSMVQTSEAVRTGGQDAALVAAVARVAILRERARLVRRLRCVLGRLGAAAAAAEGMHINDLQAVDSGDRLTRLFHTLFSVPFG